MFFDLVSSPTIVAALVAGWVTYILILTAVRKAKVRALGDVSPEIPWTMPLGLGFVAHAITSAMRHKSLQQWQSYFDHRFTKETTTLGQRVLFTVDPENIKAILATQFHDYGKGEPFHRKFKDFLGNSIFTTDLEPWHTSRQLIRPQFIKDRVSDLATFERHVPTLLAAVANGGVGPGDGVGCGRVVDIGDLFLRYTLDAATDFLLGESVGSLEVQQQEFAVAFAEVQRVQNIIARAGPLNPFVPRQSFYEGLKVINAFVNPFIERALQLSPDELESKKQDGYTFLHALASFTRDRVVLRDQLVAVLLAGRDTTAATLSWTFYELARCPQAVVKLRQEILATVGPTQLPTYSDLKSMKYLQSVINETLRLYPAVPFNVRLALKDTTLPRGGGPDGMSPVGILKDTPIGYSTLVMHRRPDLYPPGSRPDLFIPERWEAWQPKPWTFLPFNGGPRICVGQQFAMTEMSYTIVRLLQKFERIDNHMQDGGDPQLKCEIVLQPGQGVQVALWDV